MQNRRLDGAASRLSTSPATAARTQRWRPPTAIAIAAAMTLGLLTTAPTPAGALGCSLSGSGTAGSPYLVATADDLAQVGSLCGLDSAYRQTANITLPSPATGSSNHSPIGRVVHKFTGSYDGTGKLIIGLMINAPASDAIGLFGGAEGATLNDIHLIDARVSGNSDVGTLVGYADNGTSITNSSATGAVSGTSGVGGLVGEMLSESINPASIERSLAAVNVSATGSMSGGLVGHTGIAASILFSRASGRVEGTQFVGGLVGSSYRSAVSGSYATGDVYASSPWAGALAGLQSDSATVKSYAKGTVTYIGSGPKPPTVGGLIGGVAGGSTSTSSYDNDATLTDISTFSDWPIRSGWDTFNPSASPSRVWGMCAQVNSGTPFLLWEYTSNPCPAATAKTTKKTVYFTGNSAKLTAAAKKALRKVYATASTGTITKLKVTGVVNTRAYSLFTKRLAQARASAVVNYLKKLGYTGTATKATSKGSKRAKSRKADLVFTYTVEPT